MVDALVRCASTWRERALRNPGITLSATIPRAFRGREIIDLDSYALDIQGAGTSMYVPVLQGREVL